METMERISARPRAIVNRKVSCHNSAASPRAGKKRLKENKGSHDSLA